MTGGGVPASAGGSPRFPIAAPTATRRRVGELAPAEAEADAEFEEEEDDSGEEETTATTSVSDHHLPATRYQKKKMQWLPKSWISKAEDMSWWTVAIAGCFMSGKNLRRRILAALIVMAAFSLFVKVSVVDYRHRHYGYGNYGDDEEFGGRFVVEFEEEERDVSFGGEQWNLVRTQLGGVGDRLAQNVVSAEEEDGHRGRRRHINHDSVSGGNETFDDASRKRVIGVC